MLPAGKTTPRCTISLVQILAVNGVIGSNLARAELEEAIGFLAPRMRDLHPAAPAELGGVEGIYGVESLPLAWSQA